MEINEGQPKERSKSCLFRALRAREPATVTCILAEAWESRQRRGDAFCWKRGIRCALSGGRWHGEAAGGLAGSRRSYMVGWRWIFVSLWLVPSWKLGQNREVATYKSNPGHLGVIVIEVIVYLPALSLEIALWLPTSLTSNRVVYCRSWLVFLGSSLQAVGLSPMLCMVWPLPVCVLNLSLLRG